MAENTIKINPVTPRQTGNKAGLFTKLEGSLRLERFFAEGFPIQYLPKIAFAMTLGILYISNTHYSEKTVRKINAMQADVEDLRADYTTLKAALMYATKQSEVAKKVEPLGLTESKNPPIKIVVDEGEY